MVASFTNMFHEMDLSPVKQMLAKLFNNCIEKSVPALKLKDGSYFFSDQILKVDDAFNVFLKNYNSFETAAVMSMKGFHAQINTLKVKQLSNIAGSNERGYLVKFTLNNEETDSFYISEQISELHDLVVSLPNLMPKNTLENILCKKQRQLAPAVPWLNWAKKRLFTPSNNRYYNDVCDPITLNNLKAEVFPFVQNGKSLVIMDIGGGNGRLAVRVIEEARKKNINLHYILLDPIRSFTNEAKNKFSKLKEKFKNSTLKTEVITSTLEEFFNQKNFAEYKGTVDCIISSSGPLNSGVVTCEGALQNLKISQKLLTHGGKLIANGLSHLLVTEKHFKQNGLTLFSKSRYTKIEDTAIIKQDYVAQKIDGLISLP